MKDKESILYSTRESILEMLATSEKELGIHSVVDSKDILYDIRQLMSDFYIGTFTCDGKALQVAFNNGQKFLIKAEELTD